MTAASCGTDQADRAGRELEACARKACEEGHIPSCRLARRLAGQATPPGDAIDEAWEAPYEKASTKALVREVENIDCAGPEEDICEAVVANRLLELQDRGICRRAGDWIECERPVRE